MSLSPFDLTDRINRFFASQTTISARVRRCLTIARFKHSMEPIGLQTPPCSLQLIRNGNLSRNPLAILISIYFGDTVSAVEVVGVNLLATAVFRLKTSRTKEDYFAFCRVSTHMFEVEKVNRGCMNRRMAIGVLSSSVSEDVVLSVSNRCSSIQPSHHLA